MTSFKKTSTVALLTALAGVALSGSAHAATDGVDGDADSAALGNHQKHVRVDLGARTQFIKSSGFDPFSEKDALTQVSLAASGVFWTQDAASLAAVIGFDYGETSARARSDQADLSLARFILAPELRYHLLRVLVLTAKVGPTLTRESAQLSGGGFGSDLMKTSWKFGVDATAGAAVELWGYAKGTTHRPRLWATAEGGYGWTAPMKLNLEPADGTTAPQRLVAPTLDDLSISGPLFRVTVALSYW
ncbi:MAG TPA: hypothetical protein VHB79_27815 [Polyangiaceae bacterium]|nr:hypothetical protein [Polyangiaceae bacterium]